VKRFVIFCLVVFFWSSAAWAAVDREAFTFTNYDLSIRIDPEQHRLSARGKIALRNDSSSSQKYVTLQVSSSLAWQAIKVDGKGVEFVTETYASDIDHTGALSEAIVNLPTAIAPKAAVEIEVGYDGVVVQDATRVTRIGVPEALAKHSEWDQIGKSFTGVRGIGYVTWYPVATESVSLSEGHGVEDAVGRWKVRTAAATMTTTFESTDGGAVYFSGTASDAARDVAGTARVFSAMQGTSAPTFVMANYQKLTPDEHSTVFFFPGQEEGAKTYSDALTTLAPIGAVGAPARDLHIFGLPDTDASPFVTEGMLLTPLKSPITNDAMLNIVYAKAFTSVRSPRPWIQDGLAHFAQVMFIEQEGNPTAALDYLQSHQAALIAAEKQPAQDAEARSLINVSDGLYLQTKAMCVWWMLRDMLDTDPRLALLNYKSAEDVDPKYLQHTLEKTTKRDLAWFFDDWVYHDRGLPEFRVSYVNTSAMPNGGYLVTVTVENRGDAGAEVPLTLKIEGGEINKRIEVRGKSKATIRLQAAAKPFEVVVNDGSVPESDTTNNTYPVVGAK
jgi:hypothetical protein